MTTAEGLKKIDAFGKELPHFNIKGKERVNSIIGGLCTLMLLMTVSMYSTLKFSYLITKHNPNISSYYIFDEMSGIEVNLNKRNYRVAFSVESFFNPVEQKRDPRYVKYLFRMYGKR